MIEILLWDVDGTLLSFTEAERAAIRTCFRSFGLGECTDEMVARYSAINARYWLRLENGEMTKEEILRGRFLEFFSLEGIDFHRVDEFNREYQMRLGDTICYNDDSLALISRLRGRVRQYAVTNGTVTAQKRKLEKSGLGALFDGVFISDQVGAEKPSPDFFRAVLEAVGPAEKDRIMIVGDSLTSDIRGGVNAGIVTCWYNPRGERNASGLRPDHEIRDLRRVEELLG